MDDQIFDRSYRPQHLTSLIDLPILVLKSFMRKKQVLPVLHVGERIMSQCVLLISWRQVNAQTMIEEVMAAAMEEFELGRKAEKELETKIIRFSKR